MFAIIIIPQLPPMQETGDGGIEKSHPCKLG